jgi:hypothetical protein
MTTYHIIHESAADCIRAANYEASRLGVPQVIGYIKSMGWIHYDPRNTTPPSVVPEMLCFALGKVPLPLSETGFDVLFSALASIA